MTIAIRPTHHYPRPVVALPIPPARTRLRLTHRGTAVLVVGMVALVAAGVLAGLLVGASAARASTGEPAPLTSLTVRSGDSLWTMAESLDPRSDPRDVVASIQNLNGLTTATVLPGQRLAIPAAYTSH